MRREPHLLACVRAPGAIPDFWPANFERADPGLDRAFRPAPVSHDALPTIRQSLCSELLEESRYLSFQGRREHPPRAFSRNLGERVFDGFWMSELDHPGIVGHGVSLLLGGSGRLDHPPRYAAFPTFITQLPP